MRLAARKGLEAASTGEEAAGLTEVQELEYRRKAGAEQDGQTTNYG